MDMASWQLVLIKRKRTNQIKALKFKAIALKFKEFYVQSLNIEFQQILVEHQASLISNKEYSFEFFDLSIEKIFGRLIGFKTHINFE
jgi:hypothetical protein